MKKIAQPAIEIFENTIRELLLGPDSDTSDDKNIAEELISGFPLKRYYTGVLYPGKKDENHGARDRDDSESAIDDSENKVPELDDEESDNPPGAQDIASEEKPTQQLKEDFYTDTTSHFYPSDMGISFCVDKSEKYINATFSFARYSDKLKAGDIRLRTTKSTYLTLCDDKYEFPLKGLLKFEPTEDNHGYLSLTRELKGTKAKPRAGEYKDFDDWVKKLPKDVEELKRAGDVFGKLIGPIWKRTFYKIVEQVDVDGQEIINPRRFSKFKNAGYTIKKFHEDGKQYIKLQLVNCFSTIKGRGFSSANEEINRSCLFQSEIAIQSGKLQNYKRNHSFKGDSEQRQLEFLYRGQKHFAIGHNCSAVWDENNERPGRIKTSYLPTYELKGLTTKGENIALSDLSIWGDSQAETVCRIGQFVGKYADWIAEQKKSSDAGGKEAKRILDQLDTTLTRLNEGVELIKTNRDLFRAFQFTNTAMLLQFALNEENGYSLIQKNTGLTDSCPIPEAQLKKYHYRPFQLAFLLLSLESIINPESKYRNEVVDLIWFPTGGGKTEAYLAVATLTILWRRMNNDNYQGVSVIMRYTLRLLTAQQFERTSRLITVLEYLRLNFVGELKEGPISAGLWIGQSSTPNTLKDAKELTEKIRKNGERANRFQIDKCPWCNSPLIGNNSGNYTHAFDVRDRQKRMVIKCLNEKCHFHNGAGLPISVVDGALYNYPPSLLFATVDKFAMLSWRENGHRFFNSLQEGLPPDLVIQDELHLLSGPLGSISGLFETVVEDLCSKGGKKPKIIASTATTRNTDQQIKNLYNNRQSYVFPPPGLGYEDSFFAKQGEESNRCYLGFMPTGKTGIDSQVQLLSALFIARLRTYLECGENEDKTSPYWTLVSYYNSLRDVGRMSNKMGDEIVTTVEQKQTSLGLSEHRFNFFGLKNRTEELTSRIESSKIKQSLSKLEKAFSLETNSESHKYTAKGVVDLVLATNMLSVGIDISRLNIMLVNGMPRNTAEYIQASSRIGRKDKGLVISFFDSNRARDKSYFEHFISFHQSLYKQVEPLSLTPFTVNTIDKMLASMFITYMRHKEGLYENKSIKKFDKDKHGQNLKQVIRDRFNQPEIYAEIYEYCCKKLDELAQDWHGKISKKDPYETYDGKISALLKKPTSQVSEEDKKWKVMQSMRDIDSSSFIQVQIPNAQDGYSEQ